MEEMDDGWLSVVAKIVGNADSCHSLSVHHHVVARSLMDTSHLTKLSDALLVQTLIDHGSHLELPSNDQVKEAFLRGIHRLISSVIASGETQQLYDLLRWCWAMSNYHQCEIVSLSNFLQSILFIPRNSDAAIEAAQRKRSMLVVEVIERLLQDSHNSDNNDARRILSALRYVLDENRKKASSTIAPTPPIVAFLAHDLFIRLFQCASYQDRTAAEDVALYILTVAALDDSVNVDKLEFLAQFVAVLIEDGDDNATSDTLQTALCDCIRSHFNRWTIAQRTLILQRLVNRRQHRQRQRQRWGPGDSPPEHQQQWQQQFQRLWRQVHTCIVDDMPVFCPPTEILRPANTNTSTSTANTVVSTFDEYYHPTLFIRVTKMNSSLEAGRPVQVLVANRLAELAAGDIDDNNNSDTKNDANDDVEASSYATRLTYILLCVRIAMEATTAASSCDDGGPSSSSSAAALLGVLLSTKHEPDDDDDDDDDDDNDDNERGDGDNDGHGHGRATTGGGRNATSAAAVSASSSAWRAHVVAEEAFFPWIGRPNDVYVPASDCDRLWASADASTAPAALLRIVTERTIVCQYLLQRLCCYQRRVAIDSHPTATATICGEGDYAAMMLFLAQLQFCRHLLSTGQAMLFAQQQRQRQRLQANGQGNGSGNSSGSGKKQTDGGSVTGSVPTSQVVSYLQRYEALQATVHRLTQQVPATVWRSTITYTLSIDPYARFASTAFLLMEYSSSSSSSRCSDDCDDETAAEVAIATLFWQHVPLWLHCIDLIRSDKRVFKGIPLARETHPSSSSSSILVDPVGDDEHDAIDRDVLMGPLQRRQDYRVFVGCVLSLFAAASGTVASLSSFGRKEAQRRFHRTCRMIRHCRQQPPEDFDTSATALPIPTQRLLTMVQRLLQQSTDTNDGDDEVVEPVVEWLQLVQEATDTLVMTALIAVVDETFGLQPVSPSSKAVAVAGAGATVAHVAQYRRVLWQLQRQWLTDFKGLEDLLDRWTLIAACTEEEQPPTEPAGSGGTRYTLLDGLYAITWPRCIAWSLLTTTATATAMTMANRSSSNDGVSNDGPPPLPPMATISTLLELQAKEQQQQSCSSSSSPPTTGGVIVTGTFHPAIVVRALWQRLFMATIRAISTPIPVAEEPEGSETATAAAAAIATRMTGRKEAILGVHCLLRDLQLSFEYIARQMEANGNAGNDDRGGAVRLVFDEDEDEDDDVVAGDTTSSKRAFHATTDGNPTDLEGESPSKRSRRELQSAYGGSGSNIDGVALDMAAVEDHETEPKKQWEEHLRCLFERDDDHPHEVLFPNVHDQLPQPPQLQLQSQSQSQASVTVDYLLDMVLTWLHALWIDVIAHDQRVQVDDPAAAITIDEDDAMMMITNWLLVVTLEAWHVISAWFIAHQSPSGRHMVAIAQWMELLLTDAFLPVVQQISTQIDQRHQRVQVQRSSIPLVLVTATLQSAIQFFQLCLTMLKPMYHGPRKVCSQIQEDCDGLWTHVVMFIFDTWAAETWGSDDTLNATTATATTATATSTAVSIDIARETWEANGVMLSNAVGQTVTLEALAILVKERPHLWTSVDTAADPEQQDRNQSSSPSSESLPWLQPTYWRKAIQDQVLFSFLTEAVWRPLLAYEAKR